MVVTASAQNWLLALPRLCHYKSTNVTTGKIQTWPEFHDVGERLKLTRILGRALIGRR